MAAKTWTIIDRRRDVYLDELVVGPDQVAGMPKGSHVRKRTLRGGLATGVDVVEVDNGRLSFTVLPTRGMGLWQASVGNLRLGWRSPVQGPVHPSFVPLWEPGGLGWLSGFDELLCRCGLESNGGPVHDSAGRLIHPLHGRIANLPAHFLQVSLDVEAAEIAVRGMVDESRLYHQKLRLDSTIRTSFGRNQLTIRDTIVNLSAEPAELQLLYHVNFGKPLLESGSRVVAPAESVIPQTGRAAEGAATWDLYSDEQPGFAEQVYFLNLLAQSDGATEVLLRNAHGNQAVSIRFNKAQFPFFTVWKSTQAAADGYVTGLEPSINLPNTRDFEAEQGRVVRLAGHDQRVFELILEVHADAESVADAENRIRQLQGRTTARVFDKPQPGWSPAGTS